MATIQVEGRGRRGASNYELWLGDGNVGTVEDYLAWLQSETTDLVQPILDDALAAAIAAAASAAAANANAFTPVSLFGGGDDGAVIDIQTLAQLKSDLAGAVQAAVGDPIGHVIDLSGNARHWTAASNGARPTLGQDENGKLYLQTDGVNDIGTTPAYPSVTAAGFFVGAAIAVDDVTTPAQIVASVDFGATPSRFWSLRIEYDLAVARYFDTGDIAFDVPPTPTPHIEPGIPFAASAELDAAGFISGYVNNAAANPGVNLAGLARTATNRAVTLFAREDGTSPFNGRLYRFLEINRPLTPVEKARVDLWFADGCARRTIPSFPYVAGDGATSPTWPNQHFPTAVHSEAAGFMAWAWESYNFLRGTRQFRVRVYNHQLKRFSPVFTAGDSPMVDDDHGSPIPFRHSSGIWHMMGGSHLDGEPIIHLRTVRPDDLSEWVEVAQLSTPTGTYTHMLEMDGNLWMFMRDGLNFSLYLYKSVVTNSGKTIVWTTPATEILNPSVGAGRIYLYRHMVRGDDIHLSWARSDYGSTERINNFHAIMDKTTNALRNIAGSFSTAVLPVPHATAITNFKIVDTSAAKKAMSDFIFDPADATKIEYLYSDDDVIKYQVFNIGGAPDAAVTLYTSNIDYANPVLTRDTAGARYAWFLHDVDADGRQDLLRMKRPAGSTTWQPAETIRRATSYRPGGMSAVLDGPPEARVLYSENTDTVFEENGGLRIFIHGDEAPLEAPNTGPDRPEFFLDGALLASAPVGAEIGVLQVASDHGAAIRNSIVSEDPRFSYSGGFLKVAAPLVIGNHYPLIRATDHGGVPGYSRVRVPVIADSTYGFTNSEAEDYVERTGAYYKGALKAAVDGLWTALEAAGLTALLDVFVPSRAPTAYAGRLNLMQADFDATFNAGSEGVMFSTEERFQTLPGSNAWVDTGFDPVTAAGNFAQDSSCLGIRSYRVGQSTLTPFGWHDGTDGSRLMPRNTSDALSIRVNQTAASTSANGSVTDGSGMFSANRSGAGAVQAYHNGAAVALTTGATQASVAMNSHTLLIGRSASATYQDFRWLGYWIGGSLDAAAQLALYNAIVAFEAAWDAAL